MSDCLDEGALIRVSRDDHSGIDQRFAPIQCQIPLFLVDAVMAFVATLREDRTNLILEEFRLLRRQGFTPGR